MFRRSLIQVTKAFRGLQTVACNSSMKPPLTLSPVLINSSLIKAPIISPLINPARILPPSHKAEVELPYLRYKEITLPNLGNIKSPVTEPTTSSTVNNEIRCAVMIQIRRKKMKKHQLKKLRKRMKFLYAKVRLRREKAKERVFKAELLAQVEEAKNFDAEQYITSSLQKIRDRYAHIETPEQIRERILDLKRKYRSNVQWIKPKLD